jgi:hypothetical protein
MKQKDASGKPMLLDPVNGDGVYRYMGRPVSISDGLTVAGALSGVTSSGTTPPAVTISTNTPNRKINLRIICTTLGARGTSKIKWSFDGGVTYSDATLTAATVDLTEYRAGYTAGESTGLTISMANAAAAVDNVWVASPIHKYQTLICKRGALAFWFNQGALQLQTETNIANDSQKYALHLYHVAHRYQRTPGSTRGGIVSIFHN